MTCREIIANALLKLNVSQPNTQQFNKGRLAIKSWWKQFSTMNCINLCTDVVTVPVEGEETELEDDEIGHIKGVHSAKYGYLTIVDLTQWIEHKDDPSYCAISLKGNHKWKFYHKYDPADTIKAVYCEQKDFDLDDELDVGLDLEPLIELFVCKEMGIGRAELYPRLVAEYNSALADAMRNRMSFVAPTREL